MLICEPTEELVLQWKKIWNTYKDQLKPNRKSGQEMLAYLTEHYELSESFEKEELEAIQYSVTMNRPMAEKLPDGKEPEPRAFFLKNKGNGAFFYQKENQDPAELWGEQVSDIFIGLDLSSGYYMVEGSTLLWDELCTFQGLDEEDLKNFFLVAQYVDAMKRVKNLERQVSNGY